MDGRPWGSPEVAAAVAALGGLGRSRLEGGDIAVGDTVLLALGGPLTLRRHPVRKTHTLALDNLAKVIDEFTNNVVDAMKQR